MLSFREDQIVQAGVAFFVRTDLKSFCGKRLRTLLVRSFDLRHFPRLTR